MKLMLTYNTRITIRLVYQYRQRYITLTVGIG